MLWPETKQVRFDCLPRSRHLLHNQKFLCNLMRQGEHEVQSCCGNGVMIHRRPESKLAMLCREHQIHGDESKQQKGHTSMAEVDFLFLFKSCKQSSLRATRTDSALSVIPWVLAPLATVRLPGAFVLLVTEEIG